MSRLKKILRNKFKKQSETKYKKWLSKNQNNNWLLNRKSNNKVKLMKNQPNKNANPESK